MSFATLQRSPRYRVEMDVDVVTEREALISLPLWNISTGGAFLRTQYPERPGSALSLLLPLAPPGARAGLALSARVVHVVAAGAPRTGRMQVAGMGVRFEGMSPSADALVRSFVEQLAQEAGPAGSAEIAVRFVGAGTIVVASQRAVLAGVWRSGLEQGGLYAAGEPPPLGTRVRVLVGPLTLSAEVVFLDWDRGAGLQVDIPGAARASIEGFLRGAAERLVDDRPPSVPRPPLGKVLAAARTLFVGIENNDPFAGIGLPQTATAEEVAQRVASLSRVFGAPRSDATPPQRARLDSAARALSRVEALLLERAAALRREAELAINTQNREQARRLRAEADVANQQGAHEEARRLLVQALAFAPGDEAIQALIARHTEILDGQRARDLLEHAEVFVDGVGMRNEALRLAREAAQLSALREIRLRALRVLAKGGAPDEAATLAQGLVDVDARDPLALQALLHLHERAERWLPALRAGRALLRERGDDAELRKRVERIAERAQRSRGRG